MSLLLAVVRMVQDSIVSLPGFPTFPKTGKDHGGAILQPDIKWFLTLPSGNHSKKARRRNKAAPVFNCMTKSRFPGDRLTPGIYHVVA